MELRSNYNNRKSTRHKDHTAGFTLIEVLVTLGIVVLALGMTLNVGFDTFNRTDFSAERDAIVRLLQQARGRAIANIDAERHVFRVDISQNEYVLYAGNTASEDPDRVVIPIRDGIEVRGANPGDVEIVFYQVSGRSLGGTLLIRDETREATIEINQEGAIIW